MKHYSKLLVALAVLFYAISCSNNPQPEEGKEHLKRSKYDIGFVLSTVVFIALIFTLGLFPSQIIEIIKTGISLLG